MINDAAFRLKGLVRTTPLLSSPFIDSIAGRRILIKPECLQHTGSFKYRGAYAAISALTPEERTRGVIAYSSGNHAQGISLAAKQLGVRATIIMPSDAPKIKVQNTRHYGADIIFYDRTNESREKLGQNIAKERNQTLIRPYDEPQVIAGQGTTGLEIAFQSKNIGLEDAEVLVCCGGGGLTSGIAIALAELAPKMVVRTVEPEGFDDTAKSLAGGERMSNKKMSGSICDAIVTPIPGEITFPIMQSLCGEGLVVSEKQVLSAMVVAFERLKLVAEPGGAVALAAALFNSKALSADTIVVVVSGGNVDNKIFHQALKLSEQD